MAVDWKPPQIEGAPGITWNEYATGWEARWQAHTYLVKRGWEPKSARVWFSREPPNEIEAKEIADECTRLQDAMLVWSRGGIQPQHYDGTLKALIYAYQTDPDSRYRQIRYSTRQAYDSLMFRLETEHGALTLDEIRPRLLLRWHETWTAGGKVTIGRALIRMLRTLFAFGATILEDRECERLCGVMSKMRFKMGKPRTERLTAEQAKAVIDRAHLVGLHSVALAQAFQFECMLRQRDVIGEWVPLAEPGTSDVIWRGEKWLRGIRWEEIDENLILRHITSKRQKLIEVDLKLAPMVMAEFARIGERPASGPIVIYEGSALPYNSHQFRREWRKVATDVGIPKGVFNMDSRAGAISEATDAGAELEHVRHAATHEDISMTQRYSRGSADKVSNVMTLRAAHRKNKAGT